MSASLQAPAARDPYQTGKSDEEVLKDSLFTTRIDELVSWSRKNSLWPMPMGLACWAIE